jgi:acyl-CoA synthetase (AMP-forming)/AMP-acid ligase II
LVPIHPDVDGRAPMSYSQLKELAVWLGGSECAAFAGLGPGARIAAVLPSHCPELAACFLAVTAVGRYAFAPLNPELTDAELCFELGDLPAAAVVVFKGKAGCKPAEAGVALGIRVIELAPDPVTCGLFTVQIIHEHGAGAGASVGVVGAAAAGVGRDAVALVMHTSGTTRRPKLVPHTHGELGIGAICIASTLKLTRTSVALNVMPLFHLHGLMINIVVTAVVGAMVLCAPRFDAVLLFQWLLPIPAIMHHNHPSNDDSVDENGGGDDGAGAGGADTIDATRPNTSPNTSTSSGTVQQHGRAAPTWCSAVPTIHQEVLRQAELLTASRGGTPPPHSLTLLRNCSAALAPSIAARLEAALPGVVVITSYAMTEVVYVARWCFGCRNALYEVSCVLLSDTQRNQTVYPCLVSTHLQLIIHIPFLTMPPCC